MERRFFYHAFGLGFGGRVTRPCCEVIDAQAATVLPTVGGYASSRVDGYGFRDIVSIRSARTYAAGSQTDDGWFNASITVRVEGLNILDVVTAESLTARLASRHKEGGEPLITAVGTEFRGLRIGGIPVDTAIQDGDLHFAELSPAAFTKTARAKGEAETRTSSRDGASRFLFGGDNTLCTLVKTESYAIQVPTVGTIFLGEILASGYARRLTMVRVKMGSPVAGDVEFASAEVNGYTYP